MNVARHSRRSYQVLPDAFSFLVHSVSSKFRWLQQDACQKLGSADVSACSHDGGCFLAHRREGVFLRPLEPAAA
jgi:hypothetical protein